MTRRIFALLAGAVMAALPLVWMVVSPNSGQQLLQISQAFGL
jgi:hypothetical protein